MKITERASNLTRNKETRKGQAIKQTN